MPVSAGVIRPQDIGTAIKTCPRAGTDYLQQTLTNLQRATHDQTLALAVTDGRGLTLHQNAAQAIRLGVDLGTPWVLVLEDDLDFCDDFLGSVARWLTDHAEMTGRLSASDNGLVIEPHLMYVFGANYSQIEREMARGRTWWDYPAHAFYGAQALCWRRAVAAELVAWLGSDPYYEGADGQEIRDHGHDLLLQRWGRTKEHTHFLASAPSFVQHVGEVSGIGNRFFRFENWPGRAWRYEGRGRGRAGAGAQEGVRR